METPMLKWLREHIKNTPKEELRKEWEEIQKMGFSGAPTVKEYLDYVNKQYR